jgi:hypothetical protein
MALADNLTEEKARLTTLLEAEYSDQNLRDHLLDRLFLVRSLLGELAGVGGSVTINGGDASAANQTAVQANAGSDASKAVTVQGVTGGKAIPVTLDALPAFSADPTVNIGTAPDLTISSTERTPSLTSVTNAGTIVFGARSVSIANVGSAAGTILGTSVDAGMTVNFTAQGSDTLAAIAYNATGTTFLIAEVR